MTAEQRTRHDRTTIAADVVATQNATRKPTSSATTTPSASSSPAAASPSMRSPSKVAPFDVAVPSWGVGTGGTRFARFPGPGEPRDVFDKLEDCAVIQQLTPRDADRVAAYPLGQGRRSEAAEAGGRRASASASTP